MTSDLKRARIYQRNLERARREYLLLRLLAGFMVVVLLNWIGLGVICFIQGEKAVQVYMPITLVVFMPLWGLGVYWLFGHGILPARRRFFRASDDYEDLLNEGF